MNRLTLVATIGAVLLAAILGLIYAVSKQDVDDTPEVAQSGTAQTEPATPPATQPPAAAPDNPAPAPDRAATQPPAAPPRRRPGQSGAGARSGRDPAARRHACTRGAEAGRAIDDHRRDRAQA